MNRKLMLAVAVLAASALTAPVAVAASSPSVSTGSASSIGTSTATLKGTVNPNGLTTSYHFEYGLTSSYGVSTSSKSAGRGTKAVNVSAAISKLVPGTTYHYRLFATNKNGTSSGTDHTLKTGGNPPPDAATGPANGIGPFSATLTGVVNPHGATTSYVFQYGLTAAYGSETFGGTVAAGSTAVIVFRTVSGLQPGAIFHYRLVAIHGTANPTFGADQTFMTLPSPRPNPKINVSTTPSRDKKAPYSFTTFGRISGPSQFPKSGLCAGTVTVKFFNGKKKVASSTNPVQADCSFNAETSFKHLPGHGKRNRTVKLKVEVHFNGNGYLAPKDGRNQTVTLGKG